MVARINSATMTASASARSIGLYSEATISVARGNFTLGVGPTLRVNVADAIFFPLVARRGVQSAESRSQAVGNDVQLQVALTYLDLLEVHAMLAINADTLMRAELDAAKIGAKAGLNKTAADANRASTEVNLREQERAVLRGRAGAISARLNQLLMLDAAVELTPLEPAVVPLVMVPGDLTIRQLIETAVRARPEMHAATAELEASETLVKHARTAPHRCSRAFKQTSSVAGSAAASTISSVRRAGSTTRSSVPPGSWTTSGSETRPRCGLAAPATTRHNSAFRRFKHGCPRRSPKRRELRAHGSARSAMPKRPCGKH